MIYCNLGLIGEKSCVWSTFVIFERWRGSQNDLRTGTNGRLLRTRLWSSVFRNKSHWVSLLAYDVQYWLCFLQLLSYQIRQDAVYNLEFDVFTELGTYIYNLWYSALDDPEWSGNQKFTKWPIIFRHVIKPQQCCECEE
jgi:hypothetical protein